MYIFYTQLSFRKTCLVFPENYVSMLRSRLIWLGSSHYWIEWRMRRFIGLIHTHIHTHTHTYTYSLNGVNRKQKHYITTNNIWATEMSDEALTVFQKPRVTYEYRIHFFILFPLLFFFLLVFKFFFLSGFFFTIYFSFFLFFSSFFSFGSNSSLIRATVGLYPRNCGSVIWEYQCVTPYFSLHCSRYSSITTLSFHTYIHINIYTYI